MNCRVNIAAVASGDIGISYCQEVSTAGRKHRHFGIKINQKKITLNQFIKRVLPNADIKEAKKMYKELNMDKR